MVQAEEALCLWQRLGDLQGESEALFELGTLHYNARQKEEAARFYSEALQRILVLGSRRDSARAWVALGYSLVDSEFGQACNAFEMALLDTEPTGDLRQQARALLGLGACRFNQGNTEDALDAYRQALKVAEEVREGGLAAEACNGMGQVLAGRGESREALDSYEKALALSRAQGDRELGSVAASLTGLASFHRRRGEPQKALDKLLEALKISDLTGEVEVLNHLGAAYLDLGDAESALARYEQALEILRRNKDRGRWMAGTLTSIGQVYRTENRAEDSLPSFEEALAISREVGYSRGEALALHNLGMARLNLGETAQARRDLEQALPLRRQTGDRQGEASTLLALGKVHQAEGDLETAATVMRQALKLAEAIEATFLKADAHFGLARLERERDHLEDSLAEIRQAISLLKSVRSDLSDDRLRSSFLSSKRSFYDFYVDLLLRLDSRVPGGGFAKQALEASEAGRARSLLDLLAEGRLDFSRGISPELKSEEQDVLARLSQIQRQLTDELSKRQPRQAILTALREHLGQVETERQTLQLKIQAEHPLYAQVRYPPPLHFEGIQEHVNADTAFLEYFLGEESAYLFVVTRERLTVHRLPDATEISAQVRKVRSALADSSWLSVPSFVRAAYRLYEMVVAPARIDLAGKRHLLIAPDGALHFLAFEALITKPAGSREPSSLPYFLGDFSVSYVPSASVLSWLALPRPSAAAGTGTPEQLVAFADPYYGPEDPPAGAEMARSDNVERGGTEQPGWRFPRLEGSEREVKEIAKRYPASEVKIYRGEDANEGNVKGNPLVGFAKRLHFATHAILDEQRPEWSGLALTRTEAPEDDGVLRVFEIFNLELSADLVVLSACETGLGELTGEGLVGVTRAFLYAGAPSVVVSLWRVADTAAPDLMLDFYESLDRSGHKAEALRQAKLKMIRHGGKLSRPYFWAPFVLVGRP